MLRKNCVTFVCLLLIAACQPTDEPSEPVSSAADSEALRTLVKQYDDAINTGNVDDFKALFASNAVQMPPDQPEVVGAEAIGARIATFLEKNDDELKSNVEEIEVSGDWAMVRLTFTEAWSPKAGGDTTSMVGKGVQICKRRADGSWLITGEIWNHDEPRTESAVWW